MDGRTDGKEFINNSKWAEAQKLMITNKLSQYWMKTKWRGTKMNKALEVNRNVVR